MIRGLKSMETPIFEGNRIYCNFVRPHMGLKGMTPAEVAGIGIEGGDKWLKLLKSSVDKK